MHFIHLLIYFSQFEQNGDKCEDLPGYRQDVLNLCAWFWYFGYDLKIYANLKVSDISNTINKLTGEDNNDEQVFPKYSSLVFCILSHGETGKIHGVDGLKIDLEEHLFTPLKTAVNSYENCELLFIIQACRVPPPPSPATLQGVPDSLAAQNQWNQNVDGKLCIPFSLIFRSP